MSNTNQAVKKSTHDQHDHKPALHHISTRQKVIVMLAVMSAMFLVSLDQTIIAAALGKIVEDFQSFGSLSWVVTAYMLTMTVAVPLAGKLSDMFGRKKLLISGVAIFTIASLLSGVAQDITSFILFRALQGVGAGVIFANAFTIIGDLFTPRERGRWQGLIGAVFALSSVAGPLLGGFFTDAHTIFGMTTDWRWNFWINIPIGIVSFILIWVYCPHIKHEKRHVIDYLGAAFLTLMLSTLILGVDNTESIFKSIIDAGVSLNTVRALLLGVSAISLIGFILVERKAKSPIIPLNFFRNPTFRYSMIIMTLFGAAFMAGILYLTQFNQQVFGASATDSGMMLLPFVLTMSISSATGGIIMTKTGRYKLQMVLGLAVVTIAMFMMTRLTADSPYWFEAIAMAIAGLGMGQCMPTINNAVQNQFKQSELGAATSSTQLFRSLGSTVGTAVMGSILTAGVAVGLGSVSTMPFITELTKSPAASQILNGQAVDASLAVSLNEPSVKKQINESIEKSVVKLPEPQRTAALQQTKQAADDFYTKVTKAFADSLHQVFWISFGLSLAATVIAATLLPAGKLHGLRQSDIGIED